MNFKKRVFIADYQAVWATQFEELKSVFEHHLAGCFLSIEHVGSTAVPGLAAKPVLDIDIVAANEQQQGEILQRMEALGYRHVGDQGIAGREVLKAVSEFAPLDGNEYPKPRHHLYVCRQGALSLRNHLLLRDYLRANPQKVQEYGDLKKRLAQQFPYDIDAYIDGKTPFILDILKTAGLDQEELGVVGGQNLLAGQFTISPLTTTDQPFLREMFYLSLFVPPGVPPFSKSIIDQPHLARYHQDWGRESDFGLKALAHGQPVGAAWSRYFPKADPGYGFVNEQSPEIGIAIRPTYRSQGLGTRLLTQLLKELAGKGVPAVSLSTDRRNRAYDLYRRLGFDLYVQEGDARTMVKELTGILPASD